MSEALYQRQLATAFDYFVSMGFEDLFELDRPRVMRHDGYELTVTRRIPKSSKRDCYEVKAKSPLGWHETVTYQHHVSKEDHRLTHEINLEAPWKFSWRTCCNVITPMLAHCIENYTINNRRKGDEPTESFGESAISAGGSVNMSNKGLGGRVSE